VGRAQAPADGRRQKAMRMLDICSGEFGWASAFAANAWDCVGIDLNPPTAVPPGCSWWERDIMELDVNFCRDFDFICASTPCQEFSLHGQKHFHPNPPYPLLGIKLFNHAREICEDSGVPYVMENVRAAQDFIGVAVQHCGSFYLWGSGVPAILPQGIKKGLDMSRDPITGKRSLHLGRRSSHGSKARALDKATTATIPPELSYCVARYAERLLEQACTQGA
jgi:hypothetical protein